MEILISHRFFNVFISQKIQKKVCRNGKMCDFLCVDEELIGFFIRIYRTCISNERNSWFNEGVINHFCWVFGFGILNFNLVFYQATNLSKSALDLNVNFSWVFLKLALCEILSASFMSENKKNFRSRALENSKHVY